MGKRTRSSSDDYECISKKVKKLERKLLRARGRHRDRDRQPRARSSSSSSSSTSTSSSAPSQASSAASRRSCSPPSEPLCIEDVPTIEHNQATSAAAPVTSARSAPLPSLPSTSAAGPSRPSTSAALLGQPSTSTSAPAGFSNSRTIEAQQAASNSETEPPLANADIPAVPELNEELLKILGDDPSVTKVYGKDIWPDLAVRLQHIAVTGLPKETRNELLQKYLIPANSILIDAPTLNLEIKAAVHEHVFKRDKCIEIRQRQIAAAISCVAEGITLLFTEQPHNTKLIQLLMDTSRILCDSQNAESLVRRNFVLHNLKKELKDEIQTTKIDKLLFGEQLTDTLKAARAINKSGDDLKLVPATPIQQHQKKNGKPFVRNLNWRGPPQNYRPKGAPRTKEPVQRNRRDISSKRSSRPANTRQHHRR